MKHLIIICTILLSYTAIAQPQWQQKVDTKIDVRLDDKRHLLYAYEELVYTNNSPDTLKYIYMHLWPNAYKNDHTPLERQFDRNHSTAFYYSKPADKGYIDSLQFSIDGQAVDFYSSDNAPDIARIDLLRPLLPGKSMTIATPFKVKIPRVFSRMGHTKQAYYISQWFPKPAVYDQKGWHPISYLDQGEFFSEYGSYDVSITLPKNYVVMATGNCLDEQENQWLDELAKKPLPDVKYKGRNAHAGDTTPPSSAEMKTLHYHEDNIHDFAWFADKRWLVRKDTVVSPGNGQVVTTWAAFMPSYWQTWQKATGYLKETVRHYGKYVGPYQYKTIKAVLGDLRAGGGMEYPTVTVIDKSASGGLQTVIVHEAGHNWFYGMLGSNERDHAWMDEGINTFYEQKTNEDLNKLEKSSRKGIDQTTAVLYERMSVHTDQAIDQTSENFEKLNYGLDIYYKTASHLRWLEKYMGDADFEAGMHDYYNTWHFHHPYPADLEICLQRHTGKPLNWFFDTLLHTDKKIDFTILKASTNDNNTEVTVRNNTGVYAPLCIDAYSGDSATGAGWSAPFTHKTTITIPGTNWNKLRVDTVITDAKSPNDTYRRNALFHHFGLKLRSFAGWNMSEKDKLFISPAVGYNQYDGIMAGLVLHDLTIPENRFRFILAPLYSFQTQSVVGAGSVGYAWYPGNIFQEILLQADGKTFHYNEAFIGDSLHNEHRYAGYTKIAPSVNITFKEHDATSPVIRTLILKGYYIDEDYFNAQSFSGVVPGVSTETLFAKRHHNYGLARYQHQNRRTYNPFSYELEGQIGADFAKVSATGKVRVDYNTSRKALYLRAYLGKFFAITNTADVISRYELNATYSGMDDYLYDGTYIARSAVNKLASQQISIQEGGFKVPTLNNAARSDNWMGTINMSTDLPRVKLLPIRLFPVRLFFDAGLIPNANPSFTHSGATTLLYDGGVELHIINNFLSVYIPVIMSNDFQNYLTNSYGRKNVFARSISFTLQFQNINWLKAPSSALKMAVN